MYVFVLSYQFGVYVIHAFAWSLIVFIYLPSIEMATCVSVDALVADPKPEVRAEKELRCICACESYPNISISDM